MKTNEHIAAIAKNVANASAFAISSICDQKVSLFNIIPLKIFPYLRAGDRERIAPKVWQLQAIMNPPITSCASGFSYRSAVNDADPEFWAERGREFRAFKVFNDPLGHPPEPTLGCSQPMQQRDNRCAIKQTLQ